MSGINHQHHLQIVIQNMPVMMDAFDENWNIIVWNRECERITGYRSDEIVHNPDAMKLLYPDDGYRQKMMVEWNARGNDYYNWEWEITCKQGDVKTISWSNISGQFPIAGWASWGMGVDVTDLKNSEERYRALVESVSDGVALVQNKTFIFVNPALLQIFGYDLPGIASEHNNTTLMNQKFHQDFSSVFKKFKENSTDNSSFRMQCTDVKGHSFWIEAVHKSISHVGKPATLFSIRDITSAVNKEMSVKKEAEKLRSENVFLRSSIKERYRLGDIIGKSQAMQQVYEQILKAAACDANVIITGESGTGKELVAKAIHNMGNRSGRHFVPVNCGAIPESLIESEFFGYRKGAFTNALRDKQGFISSANGGTLFLDEVGEISQSMQSKLLRTIETGEYIRIGDNQPQHADTRIIAATNKDFHALMKSGPIREDFYFRLAIISIHLPHLRDRREDIPLLVDYFMSQFNPDQGHADLPAREIARISSYEWPGNVRELQSAIRRYFALGKLGLPDDPAAAFEPEIDMANGKSAAKLKDVLESFEKQFIYNVLKFHQWHKGKTASYLGIDPKTLYRKMIKLGL